MRVTCFCVACAMALVVGCSQSQTVYAPNATVSFLPTVGSYLAHTDNDQFYVNLQMMHDPSMSFPENMMERVELLPASDLMEVGRFTVGAPVTGKNVSLRPVHLLLKPKRSGEHLFSRLRLSGPNGMQRDLDVGELYVRVVAGERSGLFSYFRDAGVFGHPMPLRMAVKNHHTEPVRLLGIQGWHPRIDFAAAQTLVDGFDPLPDSGLPLAPDQKVEMRFNWTVDLGKNEPINLDIRPLLLVEQDGRTQYTGLHNMVFRFNPADPRPDYSTRN